MKTQESYQDTINYWARVREDWGFPDGSVVKNSPANAGGIGSIPGSGRSLDKEMATHSGILAWEIPCTRRLGLLQSMGSKRFRDN